MFVVVLEWFQFSIIVFNVFLTLLKNNVIMYKQRRDYFMIHVSQFYSCSSVESAIELYYIAELGKYLRYKYGKALNLDGVLIKNDVRKSKFFDYFRMACDEGWVVNTGLDKYILEINAQQPLIHSQETVLNALMTEEQVVFDRDEFNKRQDSIDWSYRNPIKKHISFAKKEDKLWLWDIGGEDGKHFHDNKSNIVALHADMAIISLVSMVAVERLMTGVPSYFAILFSQEHCNTSMSLSLFNALEEISSCFSGWVLTSYDKLVTDDTRNNLSYQSWYVIGKEKGMLSKWYSPKEKLDYLTKLDIKVGDIVCFYERKQAQQNNAVKSISNCQMAIVRGIGSDGLTLDIINTIKPYYQGKCDFDNNTVAVKRLYGTCLPYENINLSRKKVSWMDCGVEYMMEKEIFFITHIDGDDYQTRVIDKNIVVDMSAQDLVYYILKDYNVEFNEERFLERYFKNEVPLRTKYIEGVDISAYYHEEV